MKKPLMLIVAALLCILPFFAFAEGVDIRLDAADAEVGQDISVKVTFAAEGIGAVDAKFKYEESMLTFLSGNNAVGSSGSGRIIVVAGNGENEVSSELKFRALKPGKTVLTVEVNDALTFSEQSLGQANKSIELIVTGEAPSASPTEMPSAEATPTATPVPETVAVHIDGEKMLLAKKLPNEPPQGYSSAYTQYNSQNIEIAQNERNGELLAYVYDTDMNGHYYIWDKTKGTFSRVMTAGTGYLLLPLPDSLPEEFSEYSRSVIASGATETECLLTDDDEIRIVYAARNGEAGFCMYDTVEGTLQRLHDRNVSIEYLSEYAGAEAEAAVAVKADTDITVILTYIAAGVAAILLIALIVTAIGRRR